MTGQCLQWNVDDVYVDDDAAMCHHNLTKNPTVRNNFDVDSKYYLNTVETVDSYWLLK